MSERIWDNFLTERDKAVFAASGYGAHQGFGKRPALIVVDVNYNFVGDRPDLCKLVLQRALRFPTGLFSLCRPFASLDCQASDSTPARRHLFIAR